VARAGDDLDEAAALEAGSKAHEQDEQEPALLILSGLTRARDLLGPPGRFSGWWRHDGDVGGGAGGISF
jgi:hypothetical protein